MSPFVSTFSNASLTRGFYFKAPTNFIVTHLMVPDEAKVKGQKQLVALYRRKTEPIQTASRFSGTPVFKNFKTDPGKLVPVIPPVIYKKDEWFLVLGCIGNSTKVYNSYGGPGTKSFVLGMPITLSRLGLQANLQSATPHTTMFGQRASSLIGRVRVFVAGNGRGEPYGVGSGGELDYSDPFPPSIGKKGEMIFKPGTASNTGGVLAVGLRRGNLPLPFGNLLVSPVLLLLPVGKGALPLAGTPVSFNIPNQASLSGVKVVFQGGVGLKSGLTLTNGMEWVLNK